MYGCCSDENRQAGDSGGIEEQMEGDKVETVFV